MTQAVVNPQPANEPRPPSLVRRGAGITGDHVLHGLAVFSAVLVLLMVAALVVMLVRGAVPSIKQFGVEHNADEIGLAAAGVVGGAVAVHAGVTAIKRLTSKSSETDSNA